MIDIQISSENRRTTYRFTDVPEAAMPAIKGYIRQKIGNKPNVPAKLDHLFKNVCSATKVDPVLLLKRNKKRHIVLARQLFCWLAYEKHGFYSVDVARYLGQDHTTILHSGKKFQDMIDIRDEMAINALASIAPRLVPEPKQPKKVNL